VRGFSIKNNAPLGIYCQDSGSLAREFGEEVMDIAGKAIYNIGTKKVNACQNGKKASRK